MTDESVITRAMAPKILDKEKKAREIAAAAMPLFRREGYHSTRMADIAQHAGVGKGTLYEYFQDKEAILRLEIDRYFADFERGAMEAVAGEAEALTRLSALVGFSIDHVKQWEDHCAAFFEAIGAARVEERGREWFAPTFTESRRMIRRILVQGRKRGEIRSDVDLDAMAEMVVALIEGFVVLGVLGVRSSPVAVFREAVVSVIEKGVAVR